MSSPIVVVIGSRLSDVFLEQVREAAGPDANVVVSPERDALPAALAEADVYLAGPLNAALLAAAPQLKWIHTTGAGVEGVLFPELVASEVQLTNSRGAHRVAMPEYVLMAMLAWQHHLPALVRAQQRSEWVKPVPEEVFGKTLGLLGYGEIGRAVAQRATAIGVRCIALRRHAGRGASHPKTDSSSTGTASNPSAGTGSDDGLIQRVYGPTELHEFLGACDFVLNSLPLTPETRGVIGEHELRAIGPKGVLIQLGRGPTIQEPALIRALQEGWIAGAFLDVFDQEPLPSTSPLWKLENAILTSHTSGNSVHYLERAIAIFCENLRRFRAGEPLKTLVDKQLGY